jgi:hypothetical protein
MAGLAGVLCLNEVSVVVCGVKCTKVCRCDLFLYCSVCSVVRRKVLGLGVLRLKVIRPMSYRCGQGCHAYILLYQKRRQVCSADWRLLCCSGLTGLQV